MQLNGKKVAVLAADDYEDLEAWYPCRYSSLLQGNNKSVRIIGNKNTTFIIAASIRRKIRVGRHIQGSQSSTRKSLPGRRSELRIEKKTIFQDYLLFEGPGRIESLSGGFTL